MRACPAAAIFSGTPPTGPMRPSDVIVPVMTTPEGTEYPIAIAMTLTPTVADRLSP